MTIATLFDIVPPITQPGVRVAHDSKMPLAPLRLLPPCVRIAYPNQAHFLPSNLFMRHRSEGDCSLSACRPGPRTGYGGAQYRREGRSGGRAMPHVAVSAFLGPPGSSHRAPKAVLQGTSGRRGTDGSRATSKQARVRNARKRHLCDCRPGWETKAARGYPPPRIHRRGWLARYSSRLSGIGARPRTPVPPRSGRRTTTVRPARPPGLGGGHCALGSWMPPPTSPAVAAQCRGTRARAGITELVASQRFRSRAFVGGEQSSRLEQLAGLCDVVQAGRACRTSRSLTLAKSRSKVAHEPSDSSPRCTNL